MKASEVLRKAARLVAEGREDYGCCAITEAIGYYDAHQDARILARDYFSIFKPDNSSVFWFGRPTSKNRHRRVMALLFAAELAKDGGN